MVTVKNPSAEQSDGLIYYMPKKDIVITFNVREENNESENDTKKKKNEKNQLQQAMSPEKRKIVYVTNVDVTPAYPDGSEYYVLKHKVNLLGDNKTDIGINEKGLLSNSTKAIMISKVNESLKNLAYSVGAGVTLFALDGTSQAHQEIISCPEVGNYIFKIKFDDIKKVKEGKIEDTYEDTLCGMDVRIEATSSSQAQSFSGTERKDKDRGESGIFYRQLTPYSVTITKSRKNEQSLTTQSTFSASSNSFSVKQTSNEKEGDTSTNPPAEPKPNILETTLRLETIVFLPSAKTHFLPIAKSFFANNTADFSFVDGMPTKYGQETNSEFAALFKLPGDIIGGFFGGVGAIFSNFKTINTDQSAALAAAQQAQFFKFKQEFCLAAIRAKDAALVSQYCKSE